MKKTGGRSSLANVGPGTHNLVTVFGGLTVTKPVNWTLHRDLKFVFWQYLKNGYFTGDLFHFIRTHLTHNTEAKEMAKFCINNVIKTRSTESKSLTINGFNN